MKKMISILLAALLLVTLVNVAALAEDTQPQPEGGKKYEGDWALAGGKIEIVYEEQGYRVMAELLNNADWSGEIWEYSCYYHEDTDDLVSVSSVRRTYTINPDTMEQTDGDMDEYGIDEDGSESVFAIGENGALTWKNGRAPETSKDLEFRYIGSFEGTWRSAEGEEPVWVEFNWKGLNEETYCYEVYLHRGDDTTYTEFIMNGLYNEETGKLECVGHSVDAGDTEIYDAIFSLTPEGKLLYEAANGIILEYDILGGSVG